MRSAARLRRPYASRGAPSGRWPMQAVPRPRLRSAATRPQRVQKKTLFRACSLWEEWTACPFTKMRCRIRTGSGRGGRLSIKAGATAAGTPSWGPDAVCTEPLSHLSCGAGDSLKTAGARGASRAKHHTMGGAGSTGAKRWETQLEMSTTGRTRAVTNKTQNNGAQAMLNLLHKLNQ